MRKIHFILTAFLMLVSCTNGNFQKSKDNHNVDTVEKTIPSTADINKVIDGFTFEKIETGWSESTRRKGVMYPEARVLVKNTTGHTVNDIDVLQNQFTFSYIEDDIIIDEHNTHMHSDLLPPWKPNVSKYISLVGGPSFRNMTDSYKNKELWLELYYHDQFLCKVKIAPTLVNWD